MESLVRLALHLPVDSVFRSLARFISRFRQIPMHKPARGAALSEEAVLRRRGEKVQSARICPYWEYQTTRGGSSRDAASGDLPKHAQTALPWFVGGKSVEGLRRWGLSQFCTSWPRAIDRPTATMLLSVHLTPPLRMRGNHRIKWLHTLLWEGVPEGSQPRTSNKLSKLDHEQDSQGDEKVVRLSRSF